MNPILEQALVYYARGWSVIPVGPDKKPMVSWKDYQSKRADIGQLMHWWKTYPDSQVGIVTGTISNLTVIDVEAEGDLTLIKDDTYTVQTGGGGRHYYFTYDADFTNMVRVLPAVDVRSEGGYVIAAPSKTHKGPYTVLKEVEVCQMSTLTKKTLLEAHRGSQKVSVPQSSSRFTGGIDYPGYGEGQRNDQMTKFIGSVLAKIHPSMWAEIAWPIVLQANQKNTPPLSDIELKNTFKSIASREQSAHPAGRLYTRNKTWGPAPEGAPTEASVEQVSDAAGEKRVVEILQVKVAADAQEIDTDTVFPVDMSIFDEALLGGFSPGDLIAVAGKSGHGKTSLIQDWTTTLASGGGGKRPQLATLWFSYEVLIKPLWKKFQVMGATEDTPLYLPSFNESGSVEWVKDMIEKGIAEKSVGCVAIDHLGFLQPPKGNYANQSDAITHTVRYLKKLAVKHGLVVFLPVHVRKTNKQHVTDIEDIRDSIGIAQESDAVFFVERRKNRDGTYEDSATITLSKNRKTGVSVAGSFEHRFGRYYYSEALTQEHQELDEVQEAAANEVKEFDRELARSRRRAGGTPPLLG